MDCIVHGVTKSRTRLSYLHFHISSLMKCLFKSAQLGLIYFSSSSSNFLSLAFESSLCILITDLLLRCAFQIFSPSLYLFILLTVSLESKCFYF